MEQDPQEHTGPEASTAQNSEDCQERAYRERCNEFEYELDKVGLHVLRVDWHGKQQALYLEIGEETTSDSIKEHWRLLKQMRDFMVASHGYWGVNPKKRAYKKIAFYRTRRGLSWQGTADAVNQKIGMCLQDHLRVQAAMENADASVGDDEDVFARTARSPAPDTFWVFAAAELYQFGFRGGEIRRVIEVALERLRAGKPAFEKNSPVTMEKVRSIWRSR